MTKQEIFDKVWNHFIVEKNPVGFDNETNVCMYRNAEGYKCAVGILIPDDEYSEFIEYGTVHHLYDRYTNGSVFCLPPTLQNIFEVGGFDIAEFMRRLQVAHDSYAQNRQIRPFEYFVEELRTVAIAEKLQVPERS
jgi:hypothetical protein